MTGSDLPARSVDADIPPVDDAPAATTNGHSSGEGAATGISLRPEDGDGDTLSEIVGINPQWYVTSNGVGDGRDDAASEAETLISSPVKKREAEKRGAQARSGKPQKSRIGGLPVPGDDDDENEDSGTSPMPSTEISAERGTPYGDAKIEDVDVEMVDEGSAGEDGSEPLSSVRSSASIPTSRASSISRSLSERPELKRDDDSPNPRKRKHRASSAGLPNNKRQSMDPPRTGRRVRGLDSETNLGSEKSHLPRPQNHRRAASMQSVLDVTIDRHNRKRRNVTHFPVRDPKNAKLDWAESDASSETTSRGEDEQRRPQRGIGKSMSTPARPAAREHKRHVNKYGFTRLAEACEAGDLAAVKEWRKKDPGQIEVAEFAGNTPLQIAALNGNAEVVAYLIKEGCKIDCANVDKDTPLIDAAENGHLDVVKLLLSAGVDPLGQNLKGQQALDVATDDSEETADIRAALREAINRWNSSEQKQRRQEEEELRHRAGPSKELHFMARTYENLLKLVQINDRNGVKEFLDARVPVDNAIIAAAAKTGDLYLVNMLLAEMTEKKAHQKPEKPVLAVLGSSHFEMVKSLTELDQFNPLWRSRQGKSWPELAEERSGPMWRQERELLQRLYDQSAGMKERRSSSPVTKRDSNGKRRAAQLISSGQSDEEDEEEEEMAPKRKNGRRLMSRKDIRAAGGKASSGSSDEEDSSDVSLPAVKHEDTETNMKPPDSPNTRRAANRLRSKSISSQPADDSPRTRRRSASLRDSGGKTAPTVGESMEELEAAEKNAKKKAEAEKKRQEEAELAKEEARRLRAKLKMEEEAAAEVRRKEEEARKAREEREAEEARKAEEAKRKKAEEEEARKREEARKAEEELKRQEQERQLRERELEEAKQKHRRDVLSALPSALVHVLRPDSEFRFEDERNLNFLVRYFTPLRIVRTRSPETSAPWILDIQAAALVGKQGLELFFSPDGPAFNGSLADQWTTAEVADSEEYIVDEILAHLSPGHTAFAPEDEDEEMEDVSSFQDDLARAAERYKIFVEGRKKLHTGRACLRGVKLEDVMQKLHPLLVDIPLDVRFSPSLAPSASEVTHRLDARDVPDFLRRTRAVYEGYRLPSTKWMDGVSTPGTDDRGAVSVTVADVVVVHEQ